MVVLLLFFCCATITAVEIPSLTILAARAYAKENKKLPNKPLPVEIQKMLVLYMACNKEHICDQLELAEELHEEQEKNTKKEFLKNLYKKITVRNVIHDVIYGLRGNFVTSLKWTNQCKEEFQQRKARLKQEIDPEKYCLECSDEALNMNELENTYLESREKIVRASCCTGLACLGCTILSGVAVFFYYGTNLI
jgi:hypothetical protein